MLEKEIEVLDKNVSDLVRFFIWEITINEYFNCG